MAKYIDLHSHIAWGIDDGMPCVEDAVSSLESAKKDGIVGICSTPHFIPGQLDVHIYNEMVTRQLELRKMSPIPIYFGGEVMMNSEFIEGLELDLYPTLNSSKYMLVEYNVLRDIHSIDYRDECLYELKMKGFVPVLAHIVTPIGDAGITFEFLDNGYCDVICTDTHRASGNRIEQLSDVYSFVSKRIGSENADILFYENPKLLLSDKEILNIEVEKKKKLFGFFGR